MKARLEIYYESIPSNALRLFQSKVKKDSSDANIYGLALAYEKNNNYLESLRLIDTLINTYPKNLVINNTKIDILLEAERYEEALNLVDEFLEISPKNYPLSVSKSKILLSMSKFFESEEIIRDQLLRKNNNPDLWFLLSEIQRSSKNIIGYHQSRAEYFILLGQNQRALNQLEYALKLTQNNFQVSETIMTKIIDIKKELNKSRGL
jgi:predicted Zn-dependent protease